MKGDEKAADWGAVRDGGGNATNPLENTTDELFPFESFESRPNTGEHLAVFDRAELTPSVAAIAAVSKITGDDPTEIDPPLYAAVDPGSLDDLLGRERTGTADVRIQFTWTGYDLTMTSYGLLIIRSTAGDSGSSG